MLLDKLAFTENKYEELSVKISDPSIMANQKEWRKLCKEHADLEIIVTAYREYKKVVEDLEANKEMLEEETDKEMREMLSEEISEFLKENDFEVEVVGNGDDALKLLQSRIYDLCILDIGLPDCSGFLLCKKIRQFYRNPIIIFTAYENEEDIVTGLMAGADDYVTKPCSLRVLRSRIFSQLRRKQWSEEIETEIIRSGDLVIDVVHNMIFKKGRELSIKDTEFRLCYMLVRNDGRIMPRELLLERLWDMDEHFIENNTLSVYVSRLRKKLGVYNGVSYIETIKGIGYRWNHLVQRGEFNE